MRYSARDHAAAATVLFLAHQWLVENRRAEIGCIGEAALFTGVDRHQHLLAYQAWTKTQQALGGWHAPNKSWATTTLEAAHLLADGWRIDEEVPRGG